MIKIFRKTPHVDGWKPLSLTAYLPELERGIWEQTNNHFWKRKILALSASCGIYHSIMWDRSTRAEQTPGWIKTNSLTSRCVSPLPPSTVTQTVVTGGSVQDLTFPSLGRWTGSQEGNDSEELTELRGFYSVLQINWGVEQRETKWNEETVAWLCCRAGWHTSGCCADIQWAQHSSSKINLTQADVQFSDCEHIRPLFSSEY